MALSIQLTEEAQQQLDTIIYYIADAGFPQASQRQLLRFYSYVENTLAEFPNASRLELDTQDRNGRLVCHRR